jgi:hypothetical protein
VNKGGIRGEWSLLLWEDRVLAGVEGSHSHKMPQMTVAETLPWVAKTDVESQPCCCRAFADLGIVDRKEQKFHICGIESPTRKTEAAEDAHTFYS